MVEVTSYIPPRSRISDPIRIPDPRRVMIGGNTYIIAQIPSSSATSSSNVHPPPYSHGPSSRYTTMSKVRTMVTRPIVSQVHIPPATSGGYVHASRGELATSGAYIPTSRAYIPTYGVSHWASHAMT